MTSVVAIQPGSFVEIDGMAAPTVQGKVLAVTVRESGVAGYEVAWWSGGTRYTAWVEPSEITPSLGEPSPIRIGFVA